MGGGTVSHTGQISLVAALLMAARSFERTSASALVHPRPPAQLPSAAWVSSHCYLQSSPPSRSKLNTIPRCYERRKRQSSTFHRAPTLLFARSEGQSSFVADDLAFEDTDTTESVDALSEPPTQRINASNQIGGNSTANNTANGASIEPTNTPLELWGVPVQSIILLNLVAVIWGTQHSVIKTVVDNSAVLGGANGIANWLESAGIPLGSVASDVGADSGSAAYFTLARFGLAALLASPYTPGWRIRSESSSREATTTNNNTADEKESIRLAWKYGAELGLYMFLGYAFQAIGLETTTASRSGFLLYLNVKFVPFISYFIFGKTIQRSTWISAFVAFAGTGLLAFDNASASADNGLGMAFNAGDLWSIAAAAASAMFILRMEAASKAVPKSSELNAANLWIVAGMSLLWTVGLSLQGADSADATTAIASAIQHTMQQTLATIATHPLQLVYLSGVTTAVANYLQSKAQKDVSAERASVIYAMDPVYGAIFANLLLGETLGGFGLTGAALIVVAAATNAFADFGGSISSKEKEEEGAGY